jgi:anaerobic magnesium-protoporphyrin IX monomethyl ester cyclase
VKVALIILPHPYIAHPLKHQPLGILYLAAAIRDAGFDVSVTDLRTLPRKECLAHVPAADVYGIGATTLDYKTAVSLAEEIAQFGKPIILGGVHGTAVPETIGRVFDSVVRGEGEHAVLDLLYDLQAGTLKRFYRSSLIENIDEIPLPARDLVPYNSIVSEELVEGGGLATSIISSRGCPFNCAFCAVHVMWEGRVRYRSVKSVVDELKLLKEEYKITHFKFQDDTLTLSRKRVFEMCEAIAPLHLQWMANARVDTVDIEMLAWMKEAGCTWVEFGIESASQQALDRINKGFKIERAYRAVREAHFVGMKVKELFMIGLPGEDATISDLDIAFIERTKPESAIMATLVPLPGCDIFYNPERYGLKILTDDYDEYLTNLGLREGELKKGFIYEHNSMTREEMMKQRKRVIEFIKKTEEKNGIDRARN